MSVIVGRALPDARDGLKPVHRRLLYAMHEMKLASSKPHRKSARVVGEVLGKLHPHGDTAVYAALVRLAQPFALRGPLVDGHGNFGSQDDDPAAAMRYTECRLAPLAESSLLADLSPDVVDYTPTFDGDGAEPAVLPARVPLLLLNGSQGIAVGMATLVPPHNLGELVAAMTHLLAHPGATAGELMAHMPAPDYPTGGILLAEAGLQGVYETGSGSFVLRGRAAEERLDRGRSAVVITELPYQVAKAPLVARIAALAEAGTLEGVADVRDESDRTGMRVVVELKRSATSQLVLNQLYRHTPLQRTVNPNVTVLVGGRPRQLALPELLQVFIDFRLGVIQRRAAAQKKEADRRLHLLDGLLIAGASADKVIALVRGTADGPAAAAALMSTLGLSTEQAAAVLAMPLRRLTQLEAGKMGAEATELRKTSAGLASLLASPAAQRSLLATEAREIAAVHGTPRRTVVAAAGASAVLRAEDILPNAPSVVLLTKQGFIKRVSADAFHVHGRGGKGVAAGRLREDDAVQRMVGVHDHDTLLLFSESGTAYSLRALAIPETGRAAAGMPLSSLLPSLPEGEAITAIFVLDSSLADRGKGGGKVGEGGDAAETVAAAEALLSSSHDDDDGDNEGKGVESMEPPESMEPESMEPESMDVESTGPSGRLPGELDLVMLTASGLIKRTRLRDFVGIRASGIRALKLEKDDKLVWVRSAAPSDALLLASKRGKVATFTLDQVRPSSRTAMGIKAMAIKWDAGDRLVGMDIIPGGVTEGRHLLVLTALGRGKRVPLGDFARHARGTSGTIAWRFKLPAKGSPVDSLATVLVLNEAPAAGGAHDTRPGLDEVGGARPASREDGTGEEEMLMMTSANALARCRVDRLPVQSRTARGVTVLRLHPGETLKTVELLAAQVDEGDSGDVAIVEVVPDSADDGDDDAAAEGDDDDDEGPGGGGQGQGSVGGAAEAAAPRKARVGRPKATAKAANV